VVIHDLNVMRIAVAPSEADAPLVIDPNAVGSRPATLQQFELVSRRNAEILQPQRLMQEQQLSPRWPFNRLESPDHVVVEQRRGVGTLE
jgi:hypothetical protein